MAPQEHVKSIYTLNAGSAESEHERLNAQHYLVDDIMQNDLLPPHIASSLSALPEPPKILEIATGTAIWLNCLAKTLSPEAELMGLDFDTSKFPPPSSLAPNITLRQGNMFEPFPSELLGKFDVVNVRLIIFALKTGDGVDLVKNLLTLLKPGGYIVWTETGPAYSYVLQLITSIEPASFGWFRFQDINYHFANKVGRDLNLPIGMIDYIKQAGCADCDDKAYPSNAQLYTDKRLNWTARMNHQAKAFSAQMLRGIVNLGGVEGMSTEEEAEELITQIHQEITGRKVHYLFVRAWGKKPEAS